jgi:ATP synthase protein I
LFYRLACLATAMMSSLATVPKGSSRPGGRGGNRETIVIQKPESRSALSVGYYWCARVTTIGLEFATPALLGFYLDRWWKTSPWFTVIGAFLGLGLGMTQVLRLAGESSRPIERAPKVSPTGPEEKRGPHDSLP